MICLFFMLKLAIVFPAICTFALPMTLPSSTGASK